MRVSICGVVRRACTQCGADLASASLSLRCEFPLRGEKIGHTCGRELCSRCRVRHGDVDVCPAHARVLGVR